MAIPAGLMPGAGAGGAPPIGGGLPGAPPQQGPGGGGGPIDAIMQSLLGLQQTPEPDGVDEALRDASMKIGFAASRTQLRSAKVTKMLTEAVSKIQGAREELKNLPTQPLSPPPNLGFEGTPGAPPQMNPMGPF